MPTPEDTRRRLGAALRLAGVTQSELGQRLKADGLGSTDPEQIMQGKKEVGEAHIDSFARHLNVPREWFTVDDLDAWISRLADPGSLFGVERREEIADEFRSRYAEMLAALSVIQTNQEQLLQRLERIEDARASEGNG